MKYLVFYVGINGAFPQNPILEPKCPKHGLTLEEASVLCKEEDGKWQWFRHYPIAITPEIAELLTYVPANRR